MPRDAEGETLRQIRALYATGTAGGLADGRLVERFLDRDGLDREDAFAALVQRHGPMVLAVCRRMLANPADADDAFQAVFLVLARKAGTLRRVDRLKPWLYGAAVRTARESRRRSARRNARESGSLADAPPCPAVDPDLFELRAVLDEELERLPGRYREPLLLCELEGASRQDAAIRLGLPEGTLSSRLARGRSLLRDRLTRRGIALGATLATGLDGPATAGPSVAATVRLALEFTARNPAAGTVPTALASLAEGVLPMVASFPIKTALAASLALGVGLAACLTVGLARSVDPLSEPAPAVVSEPEEKPEPVAIRGVVVDESGAPVAAADVLLAAYTSSEIHGVTGADGRFALSLPDSHAGSWPTLLARSADGRKLGVFEYGHVLSLTEPAAPARIVVKPGRPTEVRVTDANQAPIPGAAVEAAGPLGVLAHAPTGADGLARLLIPPDAMLTSITAQKVATGFDFYQPLNGDADILPPRVDLTLDAPQTARVQAIGPDGKPAPGVEFHIAALRKEGQPGSVSYASRLHSATTDAEGVATFDWLPKHRNGYTFFPTSAGYSYRRAIAQPDGETYIARLVRNETIRGRVVMPDGSPAPGVWVVAIGTSRVDSGSRQAQTEADGSYEIEVSPDDVYIVYVEDETWRARSRLDVVVRRGEPVDGVDFRLGPGTVVRGTVTVDPDGRPAAGEVVALVEHAIEPPDDLTMAPERFRELRGKDRTIPVPPSWIPGYFLLARRIQAKADDRGRYAIRVGPGEYTLQADTIQPRDETVVVANEPELVRDLHIRLKSPVKKARLAIMAFGPDGDPVEVADLTFTHDEDGRQEYPRDVSAAGAQGRFSIMRKAVGGRLEAKSADGSLAGCVAIGREQAEVVLRLSPTARASGMLLDEAGERAALREIAYWGRRMVAGEERDGPTSVKRVRTDAEGRFTLRSLIVGWTYEVVALRGAMGVKLGVAAPKSPGEIDLGTIRMQAIGK